MSWARNTSTTSLWSLSSKKEKRKGFPGGTVVRSSPANAVDLIPGPGRSQCHGATKPMYHNYWTRAQEPRSHNYWSPQALQPGLCNKRSHCSEKPVQLKKKKEWGEERKKKENSVTPVLTKVMKGYWNDFDLGVYSFNLLSFCCWPWYMYDISTVICWINKSHTNLKSYW